jgi:hypothetical protein
MIYFVTYLYYKSVMMTLQFDCGIYDQLVSDYISLALFQKNKWKTTTTTTESKNGLAYPRSPGWMQVNVTPPLLHFLSPFKT